MRVTIAAPSDTAFASVVRCIPLAMDAIFQRLCIFSASVSSDFMALYKCCYYYYYFDIQIAFLCHHVHV